MNSPVLELTKELIERPSVTPDDQGCQQLIIDRLEPLGFKTTVIEQGGVTNLWIRRGEAEPLVVFAGHTDVVPPGPIERWRSDPFTPTESDGYLFGRGASDMKSSIAGFVVSVEEFVRQHPDHTGSIALLITSDEEGPAVHGTIKVCEHLKQTGQTPDFCVVGEPTSVSAFGDTIKNGRRGSMSGKLTVKGKQGHIAYPHMAINPIHVASAALTDLINEVWDQGNDYFPATSFQISNIHAGTGAGNVIPGEMVVDFNFRFCTESTPDSLQNRTEAILNRHAFDYQLDWTVSGLPFLTPKGRLSQALSNAIEATTGKPPVLSTTGGTSDGRFIAQICPQVIEFGPTNATIHQVNESIEMAQLNPLKDVYRRTLEQLLVNG